jgi:hypothetical protein
MMKAISLWQPWAALMAIGAKRIETRGWSTNYRGPLVIHAAKTWKKEQQAMLDSEPFASALSGRRAFMDDGPVKLEFGAAIAVVNLVGCERVTEQNRPSGDELAFGDYSLTVGVYRPDRYMWQTQFVDLQELTRPLVFTGHQGFFEIPDELIWPYLDHEVMWCQVCGCTADDCSACIEAQGEPCHWVGPFKCSRCFTEEGARKDLATNNHEKHQEKSYPQMTQKGGEQWIGLKLKSILTTHEKFMQR